MNRLFKIFLASVGASVLVACGGGSDDPVDMYVGAWKSACFSYRAIDGKTYFQTRTFSLAKASATSLNGTHSNTLAHSDPACKNLLGPIPDAPNVTIQLGPKANVLGGEVDTMSMTYPDRAYPGYITANATQLFLVITNNPNEIPTGWGSASPYTRIQAKQAVASQLPKDAGSNDHLAPSNPLAADFR